MSVYPEPLDGPIGRGPNLAIDGNEDWAKGTLDFEATTAEELRAELTHLGYTVEFFKTLPAYRMALESGKYPWLADL